MSLQLERVLLVDDNEDDSIIVRDLLFDTTTNRVQIEWVSTYEEAYEALCQQQYDVCLLDYRLGGHTGLELLQELPAGSNTPIILLTGIEDYQVDVAAAKAGASDYLIKGHINAPLLERSIRYAMQRKQSEIALLQSQRFAQSIVDALPDNIAVINEEGVIVAVNESWRSSDNANRFVGALAGENYLQAFANDSEEGRHITAGLRAVMSGERDLFSTEYDCHYANGERWYEMRATRFSGDGPLHVVIAHENITSRKLDELQLLTSELSLATAQQMAHLGSWELDLSNLNDITVNPLRWSDEIFRILGYVPGAFQPTNEAFFNAVHPDDREKLYGIMSEAIAGGKAYSVDHRVVLADGQERIIHAQAEVIRSESGRPLKVVGTAQDITDQKRSEEELRHSNELLRAITEGTNDSIFAKDLEGRYVMMNSTGANLFGVSAEDIIGKCDAELAPAQAAENFTETDRRVLATGVAQTHEEVIEMGGAKHIYLTTKGPLRGRNGELVGIVGVARNITERTQNEEALRISQERFEILSRATNDAIWDWNLLTDDIWWNQGYRTLFGYLEEAGETITNSWKQRLHPDDLERVSRSIHGAIDGGGQSWTDEYRFRRADGSYAEIFDRGFIIRDADNRPVRMVGSMQDISARKEAENALRESEARNSAVIQHALDCIITIDHEGSVVEFNPAAEVTFGYTRAEALGKDLNELIVPPEFHEAHKNGIRHYLQNGDGPQLNRRIEVPAVRKDGSQITIELAATAIAHSNPPLFTAYLRDITDRKESEAALLRMRDELEVRVEQRTAELAKTNAALQIQIAERECAEAETRTRARQQEAVAELGRRALADIDIDTLMTGATALVTATLDVEIGSLLELTPEGDMLRVRAGTGWRGNASGRTVPIRKNSQAGYSILSEQPTIVDDLGAETRFAPSQLMLDQGIVSGITVLVSGYQQPFGTLGAHTTSKRRFTQDDVHFLQSMANVLAAALERRRVENEIRELNVQLEATNEQLRVENMERQMALGALRDLAVGLEQAKEEAEQAREIAEVASRAKSEFLSRMSHELRTPLNAIIGFGQILAMCADDFEPQQQDNIQQILKAGRHLLGLINEVLDISRIEAGHLALSLEPLAIGPLVQEVLGLTKPLALERNIELFNEVVGSEGESYVIADQQRLKQVLLNLVSNAVKYNRSGGQVTLTCHVSRGASAKCGEFTSVGKVRVAVRDTGFGLPPQEIESLFTPFERLSAERTQIEGTGIGLALCKQLTEAMNGCVGVESQVGEGSTFWLELPLAEGPLISLPIVTDFVFPRSEKEAAPVSRIIDGPRTILYIEDNISNVNLIERVTCDFSPNIRLLTAIQGSLGLDLAAQHQPDLILLDVNLPDMQGDVVLSRLKANSLTNNIPVVVLSADATPRQIEQMRSAGASHYLTKPLDVSQFFSVLADTLQSTRGAHN